MRIVGGKFKNRNLVSPEGQGTRPTSDRVRESIFNILAHGIAGLELEGARALDLFAGTGRYKDGQPSTPLLILEQAINDPALRDCLITIFNEGNPEYARVLRQHIAELPGIETLRHSPVVKNEQVGTQVVGMLPAINSGRSRTALTKRSSAS